MQHHIEDLLEHWLPLADDAWVLAVITSIQGSAYRKVGAMMLFHEFGQGAGILSGGCLEVDLRRHAQQAMQTQKLKRVIYDASDDADASYRLGCGGIVEIMLIPLLKENHDLSLGELANAFRAGEGGYYQLPIYDDGYDARDYRAQFFKTDNMRAGSARSHHTFTNDGVVDGPKLDGIRRRRVNLDSISVDLASITLLPFSASDFPKAGMLMPATSENNVSSPVQQSLIIPLRPRYHLAIFGGGMDAQPLAQIAHSLGWQVTVVDGRSAMARAADFPQAHIIKQPLTALSATTLAQFDCAVVMHHHLALDAEALTLLKPYSLVYIGLLGPAHRRDKVLAMAELNTEDFAGALSAPAGLALGGELPSAIALSILAQCHGVLHGASMAKLDGIMG